MLRTLEPLAALLAGVALLMLGHGLLGTVLGIMLTFEALGSSGAMDVKTMMVGLALALKATAVGIGVAIPCVGLNNALRRVVRVKLAEFDEAQGG